MNKTIACISTPLGTGAISIIRISGEKCLEIAKKVFFCKHKESLQPRFLYLGDFVFKNIKDKCLMVHFKAPLSYTGEDMVEFQCHGGEFLAENILAALLECGAALAENGEFSKRAFLNGKLTLDKAEGIIDVINATSEAELKAGFRMMKGELKNAVEKFQAKLTDCLASLEVTLDYPEHDDEQLTLTETRKTLLSLNSQICDLISTAKTGKIIKNGLDIAIIGKPNVGKSSLLNALIGEDRAIVTNIAGTTRDTITETISYNGVKFNFIDTAGIRESQDLVEKIGIERSKQSIKEADIVLVVLDNSDEITEEDKVLLNLTKNEKRVIVLNKSDISSAVKNQILSGKILEIICETATKTTALDQTNYNETSTVEKSKASKNLNASTLETSQIKNAMNVMGTPTTTQPISPNLADPANTARTTRTDCTSNAFSANGSFGSCFTNTLSSANQGNTTNLSNNENLTDIAYETNSNANLKADIILEISAVKKSNIEKIKQIIFEKAIADKMDTSGLVLTNMRQAINLKEAQKTLEEAINSTFTETVDIVAFLVRRVWEKLGKITGETEIESVIDEIFSKFCLGK